MMNGIFSFSRPSIPFGPGDPEVIESGGGVASPVGGQFADFLKLILSGGGPGADPVGQTTDIARALNELIAGPDVRGQQSAVQQVIQQDTERQTANIRERFTAGGGSQGTPSAVAESLFRSSVTPRIATAVGNLELQSNQQRINALLPFLQLLSGFAGRGVAPAGTDIVVKPSTLETLTGLGVAGSEIFGNIRGRDGKNSFQFQDPRNRRP